jgi:hypothetical protein
MTSPALERELRASGDQKLLSAVENKAKPKVPAKPELSEVMELYEYLKTAQLDWRATAFEERKRRYLQDKLPPRIQKEQFDGRRFYSRLTHNEINRVVGQQTDNPPRFTVPPAGEEEDDKLRAAKQTRWANNLLAALQRGNKGRRGTNLRRRMADLQNEIGYGALEVYLTDAYDDLDATESPDLTPKENLKRMEASTRARKLPFGIRVVDGLNLLIDEGDDGVEAVLIPEAKPAASVLRRYPKLKTALQKDAPRPGAAGYPMEQATTPPTGVMTVDTIRYYDAYWYVYIVNGVIADGPRPHGQPGLPVFPFYGLITGSPNFEEGVEGICWGMGSAELSINDMMTLMMDVMWKNRHGKFVIETDLEGRFLPDPNNPSSPMAIDLSDPDHVQQLLPGQHLINAYKEWQPFFQMPILNLALQMWGKSAQNPIAQGESPGADAAGYTVATLSENAGVIYKDIIENEANVWAQVFDHIRRLIKETLKLPVPLACRGQGSAYNKVEWLSLGPDDITDVPCVVKIDPYSDAHRLANRQSWMEGNQAGYVPRREVQVNAFGAEDPELWNDEIVLDGMRERVAQMAVEGAMTDVQMLAAPQTSGLVDASGNELPSTLGRGGAVGPPTPQGPSQPQAPTVGAAQQRASASPQFTGAARGGEDNGYVPRNARQ